jgi:hypothetical protein
LTTQTNQGNPPPSLPPHYTRFLTTTGRSARLPRIGTLPLTDSAAWGSPFRRPLQHTADHIGARRSHVPHQRLNPGSRHLHAGHHQGSRQVSPWLIPGQQRDPGFDVVHTLSTRHQWFTRVRLPGSHLTPQGAFSATLTTPAHSPTQLAVVWNLPLQGDSGGPTSITGAAPHQKVPSSTPEPSSVFVAHHRPRIARSGGRA